MKTGLNLCHGCSTTTRLKLVVTVVIAAEPGFASFGQGQFKP